MALASKPKVTAVSQSDMHPFTGLRLKESLGKVSFPNLGFSCCSVHRQKDSLFTFLQYHDRRDEPLKSRLDISQPGREKIKHRHGSQ